LTYEYYAFSNKLKNVDGTGDENYTYDEIGNLIADEEEGITNIEWTPYGKVRKVVKDDNSEVHFRYDASGNRIAKITAADTTVYARDASGNVMAVYKGKELEEQSIYGSSRLGLVNYASKTGYRSLGGKKYELSNHLGNVLAVVSDNIHLDQDSTWTSLINTTDYYPFGLAMDGRSVQDSTYRYGFNGKEEDSNGEWGSKSHYDYGFRIYNPSIAKFLSVDPLAPDFPWNSPYAFAEGGPISNIDLDGLEKHDFRFHMLKGQAGGTPALALITYPVDWLEDKIIGGTERYIRGGLRYAQNERNHLEYLERPTQHYPANIEHVNYIVNKLESTGEMVKGATDVLEGYAAVISVPMGGVESGIANSFGKRTASLIRPKSMVPRLTDEATQRRDNIIDVFRVYGGEAKPDGFSWTPINPNSVGNYRDAAGLPNVNTGRFVIEGSVNGSSIIKSRSALPLDGNRGGLLEYIIDPKNVNINKVSGANPEF